MRFRVGRSLDPDITWVAASQKFAPAITSDMARFIIGSGGAMFLSPSQE